MTYRYSASNEGPIAKGQRVIWVFGHPWRWGIKAYADTPANRQAIAQALAAARPNDTAPLGSGDRILLPGSRTPLTEALAAPGRVVVVCQALETIDGPGRMSLEAGVYYILQDHKVQSVLSGTINPGQTMKIGYTEFDAGFGRGRERPIRKDEQVIWIATPGPDRLDGLKALLDAPANRALVIASAATQPAAAAPSAKPGFEFLANLPEFRDLDLSITEERLQGLIAQRNLRSTVGQNGDTKSYHLFRPDGENIIVMFRDGKCAGIQRMRKDTPPATQPEEPYRRLHAAYKALILKAIQAGDAEEIGRLTAKFNDSIGGNLLYAAVSSQESGQWVVLFQKWYSDKPQPIPAIKYASRGQVHVTPWEKNILIESAQREQGGYEDDLNIKLYVKPAAALAPATHPIADSAIVRDPMREPRKEVRSRLDIRISAAKQASVVSGTQGLKPANILVLPVEITNASQQPITATLAHEWYGGEWPPTDLYGRIVSDADPGSDAPGGRIDVTQVYRAGETGSAERPTTIEPGKSISLQLRVDWAGTGSVHGTSLLSAGKPGPCRLRFLLIFESQGQRQFVQSPVLNVTVLAPTRPATTAPAPGAGAWAQSVNGLAARIVLTRSHVFNGTPIISTRLELRNLTNPQHPLRISAARKLTFRVVDAAGQELPKAMGSYDGFMRNPKDLLIQPNAETSDDLTCSGLGVNGDQRALIDLGMDHWIIRHDGKEYFLQSTIEVPEGVGLDDRAAQSWHGRLQLPPAPIPLKAEQLDPATLAERIDELGRAMVAAPGDGSERAQRALSLIDDPRVIPWYVKAVQVNYYSLKFEALDHLGRFNTDEALAGIKFGMATQGRDIGYTTTPELASQLADAIRHCAVSALVRSPHPQAKALLLTMWDDPSKSVRVAVAQAMATMQDQQSLDLLKKLAVDPDPLVQSEATRILKARSAPPTSDPSRPATQPAAIPTIRSLDDLRASPSIPASGGWQVQLGLADGGPGAGPWQLLYCLATYTHRGFPERISHSGNLPGEPLGPVFYRFTSAKPHTDSLSRASLSSMKLPAQDLLFCDAIPVNQAGEYELAVLTPQAHILARRTITVPADAPCYWHIFAASRGDGPPEFLAGGRGAAILAFDGLAHLPLVSRLKPEGLLPGQIPVLAPPPQAEQMRHPLKLSLDNARAFRISSVIPMNDDVELSFLARWWINDAPLPADTTYTPMIQRARQFRTANDIDVGFGLPPGAKDVRAGDRVSLQLLYSPAGWRPPFGAPMLRAARTAGTNLPLLSNRLDFVVTPAMLAEARPLAPAQ